MGLRRQDLQEAVFVPGTHAFRVYGYGTADPLAAVLRPGHFEAARSQLRPGELIFVSAQHDGRGQTSEAATARRAALVMVSENARGVPVAARLVQDFGGPEGAALDDPVMVDPERLPVAAAKRQRGRPPGSRTKKPACFSWKSVETHTPSGGPGEKCRAIFRPFSEFPRISGARPAHQKVHHRTPCPLLQPVDIRSLFATAPKTNPGIGARPYTTG